MIELTPEQLQVLDAPQQPAITVDPRSGQHYRLIKEDVYRLMQSVVKPFNRNWHNPEDDDLIRKDV